MNVFVHSLVNSVYHLKDQLTHDTHEFFVQSYNLQSIILSLL